MATSKSKYSYLQFKHPVLTLGLLRRFRFLGASLPLPLTLPLSRPMAEAMDRPMLLEDDDGSMPSGSGEPVGVAAGVWYEFSAETVAAGPGPGAAMARMEREEGEREPALLGIVQTANEASYRR